MSMTSGERVAGGPITRTRIAAALGLLSVIVSVFGLSLHGYPDLNSSGAALAHWAKTTNQQHFAIGMYIEGLGGVFDLLFAAWLWSVARDGEGGSGWISTTAFAAGVLGTGLGAISNSIWSAILDAGHRGTNPQTLATMQDITNHVFRDNVVGAVFYLLIGYVLFRTGALPRWIGGSAVLIGLAQFVPALFFVLGLVPWIWTVAVSLYLLIRPTAAVSTRERSASMATPSPAGAG